MKKLTKVKKRNIYFLLYFILPITLTAQNTSFKKLDLNDGILKNCILEFIEKKRKTFPLFQEMGYVNVELVRFNKLRVTKEDVKYIYDISQEGFLPNYDTPNSFIPDYYTYLSGKLILFYNQTFDLYNPIRNKKYIKQVVKRIKPFLGKVEHLYYKDSITGKVIFNDKEFRPDEYLNLHHGTLLKIFYNGSYEIEEY